MSAPMIRITMSIPAQMTGRRFLAMLGDISPTGVRLREFCYAATAACRAKGVVPDVVHAQATGYPVNVYPTRLLMDVWNGVKVEQSQVEQVDIGAVLAEFRLDREGAA